MKKLFQQIRQFLFGQKMSRQKLTSHELPKSITEKKPKINSQLFRKQQLINKIYNIGKHRYRIKQKIGFTESEKLRYQITQL